MWTVNANYKNFFFPKAPFQRECVRNICTGFPKCFHVLKHFKRVSKESVSKGFPKGFKAFQKGFKGVSKRFERVSKGIQSFQKSFKVFQKGFQRVSKRFQRVSKTFPKGFKPSETGFPKGFKVTSNPLKNAFVDKTCFRMEGHKGYCTQIIRIYQDLPAQVH